MTPQARPERICPEIRFEEEGHRYSVPGQPDDAPAIVSVTQVIGSTGLTDTTFFRPEHLVRGTLRHTVCELDTLHAQGWGDPIDEADLDAELKPALRAWRAFRDDWQFRAGYVEEPVYSPTLWVAGTIDAIGRVAGNKLALIDIKGPSVLPTYGIQLAAYRAIWMEHDRPEPDMLLTVHLKKTGDYQVKKWGDAIDAAAWRSALVLYRWKEARGSRGKR